MKEKITVKQCLEASDSLIKLLSESEYKEDLKADIDRFSAFTKDYLVSMKKLHETRMGLCGTSMIDEELEQKPLKYFEEAINKATDRFKKVIDKTKLIAKIIDDRKIADKDLLNMFKETDKKNIKSDLKLTQDGLSLFKKITFAKLLRQSEMQYPARYIQ